MSDTIFDKIIRRELPCDVVYEDNEVLAFKDINPQAPIHIIVIPKHKFKSFDDLKTADASIAGSYMSKISKIAHEQGLSDTGYRIVFNHGTYGQQTVDYIHAHILSGRQLNWPPG